LTSGSNSLLLSDDWGYYYIDAVTVNPTPAVPIVVVDVTNGATVEAENGILNGVTVGTSTTGYSGTGYVQGFYASNDNVSLTISSDSEGLYDVVVRYAAIYGGKQTTMSLNGAGGAEVVLADTTTAASPWANATAGQVLLNAGNNTITFIDDW
jgi:mannan endo-1,4-beta-mannosidase